MHLWKNRTMFFDTLCFVSSVGIVPGEPTDVVVTEATKSYVVLAWKPPVQRGHEGVMYYIEKVSKENCTSLSHDTKYSCVFDC